MPDDLALIPEHGGHLAENVAYFARALRAAGLPIGPKSVLEAVRAVEVAGIGGRDDLYWTLHAVFVKKREQSIVFDQAFRIFWRRRALIERMMAEMMPVAPGPEQRKEALKRVADAFAGDLPPPPPDEPPRMELDARLTVSDREVLRQRDFEQMSAEEIAAAKREIERLVLPLDAVRTRRFTPDPHGSLVDPRRSLRASLRTGGHSIELRFRAPAMKRPPLVAICDISGSMSQYSRVFLHFLHALSKTGRKVHSFVFATELTNVSRMLQAHRDPDLALDACGKAVRDWDGGTRIGATLERFNKQWARRVLGQGAIVLFISDGLERQVGPDLAREMDRLHRSCRRLIWLNPLLRFDGFAAKAEGIKTLLPHVDDFRTLHNLDSIADLCRALSDRGGGADPMKWLKAA
jgi:uncharacterized protein with von Willebrand factor type A (vWA) domain